MMKTIFTTLLLLSSILAYNQAVYKTLGNTTLTFSEKQAEVNDLFQNKTVLTPQDSADLKNYARWSQFWQNRLNPDGTTGYTSAPDVNFQNCSSLGNWEAEGPFQFPQGSNGVGRIQTIEVYKQNHQIVYIGSNTGGVFKSTDLGLAWTSIFNDSDKRIPGLGVLDIIIHPTNPDIVLIATGLSSPLQSRYGAGIYKTINGGNTWTNVSNWVIPNTKYQILYC